MNITRKNVEENIKSRLSGELLKNALDFVKYIYKTGGWNHLIQNEPIKVYDNICYPIFDGTNITICFWNNGNKTYYTNPDAETFDMIKKLAHEQRMHPNASNPITSRYVLQNPGKRKRPTIHEVIDSCLEGNVCNAAMDFVAFIDESGMQFGPHASNWNEFYLRTKTGKRLGQLSIYGADDWRYHHMTVPGEAQYWNFCLYYYTDTQCDPIDFAVLNEAFRFNIFMYCCFKDNPERTDVNATCLKCNSGLDRTIFGIEYKCLCHVAHPSFRNPSDITLEAIKKYCLTLIKEAYPHD